MGGLLMELPWSFSCVTIFRKDFTFFIPKKILSSSQTLEIRSTPPRACRAHHKPGGVLRISSGCDDGRIFFGYEIFDSGIFWVGKFGKYFFGWLGFLGYSKQSELVVVPAYPGRVVLRIKYNQTFFAVVLIFNDVVALHLSVS